MQRVRRRLIRWICTVPFPRILLAQKTKLYAVLLSAVFLFCLRWWMKPDAAAFDWEKVFAGLAAFLGLIVLYGILAVLRRCIERRWDALSDTHELAERILHPPRAGEPGRRIRTEVVRSSRELREVTNEALAREMTTLNCELFAGSRHGQEFEDKLRRNFGHVRKNRHTIRLLRAKPPGSGWVGFTHILPLGRETYARYVCREDSQRGIHDTDFDEDLVLAPLEKAHAFLIFTIALDASRIRALEVPRLPWSRTPSEKNQDRIGRESLQQAEQELYLATFEHLLCLAEFHLREERSCRVLAQAYNRRAARSLEAMGFAPIAGVHTADRETVYEQVIWFR
jgi:hypothetical protein